MLRRIRAAVIPFRAFPSAGRPGDVEHTREIVVPGLPYIVVYRELPDRMEVLRVRHGAQLYPPKL